MRLLSREPAGLSIEWKLPMVVGGLLLAVTTALCWGAYVQVSRSVELAATGRLRSVADQLVTSAAATPVQMAHRAALLAARPPVHDFLRSVRRAAAADTSALLGEYPVDSTVVAIELWDSDHKRVFATGPAAGRITGLVADDLGSPAGAADSARVGRLQSIGDTVVFATIVPAVDSGRVLGYVLEWRRISDRRRANAGMADLIGGRGGVLLLGSSPGAWTDQRTAVAAPPVEAGRTSGSFRYQRGEGGDRLAALAPVPGAPWILAVELPRDVVLAPARRFVANFALIALVVLGIGLAGAWVLSRRITRPLARLTAAADAISAGDRAARVPVGRRDELGRLAVAFNHMLDGVAGEAAARAASEEQWRSLFEQNPHPMWLFDVDTLRIFRVNEAAVRNYGYTREEFEALTLRDLRPPEEQPALDAVLDTMAQDTITMHVMRHRRKDGTNIQVEVRGRPLPFPGRRVRLVTATDITERALLEDQVRQSQKMEAVGRLAGGVAHDFNNLLTVISGYSEQLVASHDLGSEDRASAAEIAAAAARAAALTRQLLMFSRKQIVQRRLLDVNDVVRGLGPMLRRLLYENIQLVNNLEAGQTPVIGDVSQLEQLIVNLAVNAADAMPDGGTLAVETAVVSLDESYTQSHAEVTAGRYVRLVVSDTGVGMDADTLSKIFEPFFTTKAIGRGTGLGLATVYAVAKQLGGHVWVYSEPGQGATFKIYLPLATAEAERAAPGPSPSNVATPTTGVTVLLVEDEDAVRLAARRMLERSGYAVLEAGDGARALDLLAARRSAVQVVVTDLMMPGLDGRAFVERLRMTNPAMPVVFISGYTDDAVIRRGIVDSSQVFLQKPFTRDQLARAVAGAVSARM